MRTALWIIADWFSLSVIVSIGWHLALRHGRGPGWQQQELEDDLRAWDEQGQPRYGFRKPLALHPVLQAQSQ
jgi:hypothetical protein